MIMVGEIRDAETARIAIEAALTGHMVLTTLHTNDAPGAITRLHGDGDRVLPDRLGGRLRRRPAPGAQALHALQAAHGHPARRRSPRPASGSATDLEAYEPVGCARCHGSGYRGRVGIYSVMVMSERIKEMIVDQARRGRDRRGRARGGHADPARGRAGQGPRGPDQHRGGRACHLLAAAATPVSGVKRRPHGRLVQMDAATATTVSTSPRSSTSMVEERASDVHLTAGLPPGDPRARARSCRWRSYAAARRRRRRARSSTASSTTTSASASRTSKQLDFAYAIPGVARFRVNCFFQRGSISAAFRLIPQEIPTLDALGLPPVLRGADPQAARLRARHRARPARASRRRWRR